MHRFAVKLSLVVVLVAISLPLEAHAGRFVLYVHGRSSQNWIMNLAKPTGWTNVTLAYDGNARLADARVSTQVQNAVRTYCTGNNSCVIACHSAGCLRTLHAMDGFRVRKEQHNVLWVEAAASAAGGTRIAELVTGLFGDQPIDHDIRRDSARQATGWGHLQDAMTSSTMYHVAGNRDSCVWFVCGNLFLPSGVCDGLVCLDSAAGASTSGSYSDACNLTLYPGRVYDHRQSNCGGVNMNHAGVADHAMGWLSSNLRD